MTQEEFLKLYKKYLSGNISPAEEEQMLNYQDGLDINKAAGGEHNPELDKVRNRIFDKLNYSMHGKQPVQLWGTVAKIAASLLIITTIGVYFARQLQPLKQQQIVKTTPQNKPIKPGGHHAILKLANGTTVNLNEQQNGVISTVAGTQITKAGNGLLVYENSAKKNAEPATLNTISTPKGGQYKIILPDGTTVWLNAASSLEYPVKFSGTQRLVSLTGEAYFEVAKNKNMPFKVQLKQAGIQVLGTHFNVSGYEDDQQIKTTLLEGSVLLTAGRNKKMLVPGQQGDISRSNETIETHNVDVDDAVAWKNGYFAFRKESMASLMKKVCRWYNVGVEFYDGVESKLLGGTVSRSENLADLLEKLEQTGSAQFTIVGDKVIVSAKK